MITNSRTRIPFIFIVKSKIIKDGERLVLLKSESKKKISPHNKVLYKKIIKLVQKLLVG